MKPSQSKKEDQASFSTTTPKSKIDPTKEEIRVGVKAHNDATKVRNQDIKCFKYLRVGHIASQYQNKWTMSMLTNSEAITDNEKEYEGMPPLTEDDDGSG